MSIKAIRNQEDYEAALDRIERLLDTESGTDEREEFDVLVALVEHFEWNTVGRALERPWVERKL